MTRRGLSILAAALVSWPAMVAAHDAHRHDAQPEARLPVIGPAPAFTLTAQDGRRLSLADLRGKAVAVTFIFASCTDTCPLLTDKMARVQDDLGAAFNKSVAFVSITVDPERDTPEVLRDYAEAFGAKPAGWYFLTGTPEEIAATERKYGIYAVKTANGDYDHTFLTSLIDPKGDLRVQYLGYRFDRGEFRRDLLSLVDESH